MLGEIIDINENNIIVKFSNGLSLAVAIEDLHDNAKIGDKININPCTEQTPYNKIINFSNNFYFISKRINFLLYIYITYIFHFILNINIQ
ncbi:hypothetical protein JTT01_13110 [Clostridium botulinum]|nr:hypothetical protein [Clostridium botulinum]MCS4468879.1 hypothetical protein [Clostridium botulinum]MCS4481284.1 hypothetical protein [Clostridium botulinum]MCS4522948.1 hypothetical protein [Clostridium botulinum]MCS4525294.1 hypothetical protein [Clostridium botulinum]